MEDSLDPLSFQPQQSSSSKKIGLFHVKFPVKRPSLQSLRTPTFFQTSNSSNNSTSVSRASSVSVVIPTGDATFEDLATIPVPSVSSHLLDEDPFANLRFPPPTNPSLDHSSAHSDTPVYVSTSSTVLLPSQVFLQHHIPKPKRPKSSGHGQVRPANTRPAFAPRPSLPSLHTLAQMNISIPRKARKGTPGARLPHEPWNMNAGTRLHSVLDKSVDPPAKPSHPRRAATVPQIPVTVDHKQGLTLSSRDAPLPSILERRRTDPDDSGTVPRSADGSPTSALYDDADIDSIPSLSYTTSEPSSSALSRSSSIHSSTWSKVSTHQNSVSSINHSQASGMLFADGNEGIDEDDPLSYHSDFDYYTQPHSDRADSDPDLPLKVKHQTTSSEITPTPYTPLYSPDTSSNLVRPIHTMPGILHKLPQNNMLHSSSPRLEGAPRDNNGAPGKRGSPPRQGGDEDKKDRGRREGSYSGNNGFGAGDHGGSEGDGDRGRRPVTLSPALSDSEYSSSSDEGDNGTVYYSVDGISNGRSSRPPSRTRSARSRVISGSGSDDDVPLAQSMPTALRAQKSIRKQLRNERHQRRMERAKNTHVPMAPEQPPAPHSMSHTRKRSASAAPAPRGEGNHGKPAFTDPFPVEDLAKKLAGLQMATPPFSAPASSNVTVSAPLSTKVPVPGFAPRTFRPQAMDEMGLLQHISPYTADKPPQERQLGPMRSFHRSEGRAVDVTQPSLESPPPPQRSGRRPAATPRRTEDQPVFREKSVTRPSRDGPGSDPYVRSARPSEDSRRPTPTIPRASTDQEAGQRVLQRPVVPVVEPMQSRAPFLPVTKVITQQRVFIGDMQRFNMVEITDNTTAGDVIALVASQGSLDNTAVWMLFELANDFGMERPIRSYELLSDVTASWNKDKLLNAFLIKRTYLTPFLNRSNIPNSSPTHRGWVEWESKKGKWSKRWMELREHSLWLSKRETGKDEIFLCSLSNFDAYYVTRKHKSPKPFVFAIKSTDNISLFEDISDYLRVLSCNQKDGEKWMEAILVARSYVLFQERHVLFAKPGDHTPNSNTSRSRTRGQSVSARPSQPLVNVSAPFSASAAGGFVFEPGSLLAKHKGDVVS